MRFIQGADQLTPADIHDLSVFLAEARYQNWIVLLSLKRAHQWAQRLQLAAANPGSEVGNLRPYEMRAQICQPITAPLISNPNFSGPDAIWEAQDVP
jgi:hypothetical protein